MKSLRFRRLLLAPGICLIMGVAVPTASQVPRTPPPSFVPPPITWWKDAQFVKELGLSADQSNKIDIVFQAALPRLTHKRDDLNAQEAELSRLVETDAGETLIGRQSDKVEAVRAVLNKSRTLMIVHMREVLTPEQRIKFKALREQWDRDHRPAPQKGTGGR
jgi:Spy/CpxP family protein refolding chaperone